jgi:hypothetical protein
MSESQIPEGCVHILAGKGEIAKKKFYPDKTPDISLI